MEDNIHATHIRSSYFDKNKFQTQLDIIKKASESAQSKIDYATAHNDEILLAIDVVEDFLRKKHRLCYGGQAINAHLPDQYKFYDPEYSIPDYDFFTPSQNEDIVQIIKSLKKAGFSEISAKEGMHEGTIKIYVDYTPVADITQIDPKLYRILSKREFRLNGISYLDANTLRMLMYLELSRPRGEVSRWSKVYERLMLFNEFVSKKQCKFSSDPFTGSLTEDQVQFTVQFIIDNKRIFAGGDLLHFYRNQFGKKSKEMNWILRSKKPILFYSPTPENDAKQLQNEFNYAIQQHNKITQTKQKLKPITIKRFESKGHDLIPTMDILIQNKTALIFIIHQTACHSYFNIPMKENKVIRVASMDTLITLFFSLGLIKSSYFDMGSMECLANELVQISIQSRNNPERFSLPFVSILCSGYQKSLPSLIREKVERIQLKKKKIKQLMNKTRSKSNKSNINYLSKTVRNMNKLLI